MKCVLLLLLVGLCVLCVSSGPSRMRRRVQRVRQCAVGCRRVGHGGGRVGHCRCAPRRIVNRITVKTVIKNNINVVVGPIGGSQQPQANQGETTTCSEGFEPNPKNPSTCIDVDECVRYSPCEQVCINIPGSARCTCTGSYSIDPEDTTACIALDQCTDLVDIVFLIDVSGSIGTDNFKVQQNFVAKLTEHFTVGYKGARFGAVLFATKVEKLFDLDTYSSQADIASSLTGAKYSQGGTNTHLGLNYIADNNMFSPSNGGRSNALDVVITLTDGNSANPQEMKRAATRLKNQGVRVVVVGIGDQVNTQELVELASSNADVFAVSEFDLLNYIEENLINRICPRTG